MFRTRNHAIIRPGSDAMLSLSSPTGVPPLPPKPHFMGRYYRSLFFLMDDAYLATVLHFWKYDYIRHITTYFSFQKHIYFLSYIIIDFVYKRIISAVYNLASLIKSAQSSSADTWSDPSLLRYNNTWRTPWITRYHLASIDCNHPSFTWNTLWSESSLVQVMACRLSAPSHFLNQYWHIVSLTPTNKLQ